MSKYTFSDLTEIMKKLRGEGGCPWDREQTHESLKRYLIEETYETIEAIDTKNGAKMADEMGDLLLQIVFHAQIGEENETFNIDDVTNAICEKMIRRHPHVFGNVSAETAEQVLVNWDEIKKEENGQNTVTETLKSVSSYLPSLMRAQKVQSKAAKVGFDWSDVSGAIEKVTEETNELKQAIEMGENTEEELGDLLFAVVNVSRFIKANPEQALTGTINKFVRRFEHIEQNAQNYGKNLVELTMEEMDKLWEEAKLKEK